MPKNIIEKKLKGLKKKIMAKSTDNFLELLLLGMDLAFMGMKDYRESNLGKKKTGYFKAIYVFRTKDEKERIAASAIFKKGRMERSNKAEKKWDVRVTFTDGAALRDFLLSLDHDVLNSVLKNKVEVEGNLNYIYKFGFMAEDLLNRI